MLANGFVRVCDILIEVPRISLELFGVCWTGGGCRNE